MFVSTSIGISSLRVCVLAEGDTCILCRLFDILAKENLNRFCAGIFVLWLFFSFVLLLGAFFVKTVL